jgi:hypothetical protein
LVTMIPFHLALYKVMLGKVLLTTLKLLGYAIFLMKKTHIVSQRSTYFCLLNLI